MQARDLLAAFLRRRGHHVITDGSPGVNLPLSAAIKLIPMGKVALELHCNAGPVSATGVETISLPMYKALAQSISRAVAGALGLRVRGDGGWIDQAQSARGKLGYVEAGGLIVELFFLSNPGDKAAWDARRVFALEALADALEQWSA